MDKSGVQSCALLNCSQTGCWDVISGEHLFPEADGCKVGNGLLSILSPRLSAGQMLVLGMLKRVISGTAQSKASGHWKLALPFRSLGSAPCRIPAEDSFHSTSFSEAEPPRVFITGWFCFLLVSGMSLVVSEPLFVMCCTT